MTYEIYRYIFIGGAVLCGLLLILTIILFFALKIPGVLGDLSGSTAKKAIRKIREENGAVGERKPADHSRGAITDRMTPSGRIVAAAPPTIGALPATAKINTKELQTEHGTTVLQPATEETTVLQGALAQQIGAEQTAPASNETTVLYQPQQPGTETGETTVLQQGPENDVGETTVLAQPPQPENDGGDTTVLIQPPQPEGNVGETTVLPQPQLPVFEIEYEITYIHTQEYITGV